MKGWTRTRLKYVASANVESLSEDTEDDFVFRYVDISNVTQGSMNTASLPITFADAPSRARRLAKPGDTVVSTVRTYLRAVASVPLTDEVLVFSTGFAVLHPGEDVFPRFLSWYLQGDDFVSRVEANSTGVSYPSINTSEVMALDMRLPPFEEQRAISDYLDRETAQIDELIAEQQRLIRLLEERRSSVIDQVVWLGLDGAGTSPTGIDPAPQAPTHWRRARNKDLFFEATELSVDGSEELLTVSHLTGITPRSEKNVNMIESESLEGYRLVTPGDLVINTMWAWMGALGVSSLSGVVSPAYGVYRLRAGAEVDPQYLDYLYRSRPYVVEMTRHSRGIWESRLRLYPETFLRLPVVVPPLSEQRSITAFVQEQTSKLDELVVEAERLIELAKERRSALITAAVTGQIDVRSAS